MDKTEFESLVKQLKAAGLNEEQIMETFYETFQDGKMDRKDLEALAEFMGYELTDEFKNDPTADPIAGGEGEEKGAEGGDLAVKAEDLKEIQPGESKEEFQEKVEEAKEETPAPEAEPEAKESKPEGEDEIDEDKEWEEVQKKFHW